MVYMSHDIKSISRNFGTVTQKRVQHTIIGYEFTIDRGNENPACYKNVLNGINESNIFLDQIEQLLANSCILGCAGPWCIILLLVERPY